MKKNRVRRLVIKNKRRKAMHTVLSICLISIVVLSIFFAGIKVSAVTTGAKGLDTGSSEKMYMSVMVERDDCLWDIAERHMGIGYTDIQDYVAEIIELNNLSDSEIHYGEYICIPYYG